MVQPYAYGRAFVAPGSVPLFNQNFATLWRSEKNVLTVLDVNFMEQDHIAQVSNATFANNIAIWLGTPVPVPEPATVSIVFVPLAALLGGQRRGRS